MNITLITECNPRIINSLRIKRLEQFEVISLTQSERPVEQLLNHPPHIAIIDMALVELRTLFNIKKRESPLQKTKFLFLSEWQSFAYEANRYGASSFICKPFTDFQLVETVLQLKDEIESEIEDDYSIPVYLKQSSRPRNSYGKTQPVQRRALSTR